MCDPSLSHVRMHFPLLLCQSHTYPFRSPSWSFSPVQVVKPLDLLLSVKFNLSRALNDAILIPNIGALSPSQDHPKSAAHYDPPKGSDLILLAHIGHYSKFWSPLPYMTHKTLMTSIIDLFHPFCRGKTCNVKILLSS